MSDDENRGEEEQVFVRFTTKLKDYIVTDDKILVPKKLRRLGLSQIINHLLGNTGKYLLGSIQRRPVSLEFA